MEDRGCGHYLLLWCSCGTCGTRGKFEKDTVQYIALYILTGVWYITQLLLLAAVCSTTYQVQYKIEIPSPAMFNEKSERI